MASMIRNVVCAGLCALVLGPIAFAHAILVKSIPAPNEILTGPDVLVDLTFNSRVDQARSTLSLEDENHTASKLNVDVDPSSPARLIARIPKAAAGSYKLHWQVLSVDGHITRGEISFRVK